MFHATGGFKLPALRLSSASDAIERGEAMQLGEGDPRRTQAMLMGAPSIYEDANGQVARMVLSLPFQRKLGPVGLAGSGPRKNVIVCQSLLG